MPAMKQEGAALFVPKTRTLPVLRGAVRKCHGCDLYRHATQAVFGELETGTEAKQPMVAIMMIGEQPGDREDKEGRPFVGPAGKLLDRCLEEAEIDRRKVYVTNTVKHFKWEPRGKLRIHKKPNMQEIHACRPWLEAELETVRPKLVICLGAVAAQSLLGSKFKITQSHGKIQETECIRRRFCVPGATKIAIETLRSSLKTYNEPRPMCSIRPKKILTIKPLIFIGIAVNCTGADAYLI
jgi:uracil-DNA glycosylase